MSNILKFELFKKKLKECDLKEPPDSGNVGKDFHINKKSLGSC